jgi:hypothetical protein
MSRERRGKLPPPSRPTNEEYFASVAIGELEPLAGRIYSRPVRSRLAVDVFAGG